MIHAWLCIDPEPVYLRPFDDDSPNRPIGVAVMLSAENIHGLIDQIRTRVEALGMTPCPDPRDWRSIYVRGNAEYEAYPMDDPNHGTDKNPTGLRVSIYACDEHGFNLLRGQDREPIGE
jgi:hypothetical protein